MEIMFNGTPTHTQAATLAELLEEHFPSRRKELSQEFEHATEQQIYHIPDPVPVPNRLKL